MARNAPVRVSRTALKNDRIAFDALQGMEDYVPIRPELKVERITALAEAMAASRMRETQLRVEFEAVRDQAAADEWAFHEAMLGAKEQVRALFGSDSPQVQALGLKKKSKRMRPSRRNDTSQVEHERE